MARPDIIHPWRAAPPHRGLVEGVDPGLSDQDYSPLACPRLRNIRVGKGLWETRYGISLWQTLPGAGTTNFLGNSFPATSGNRYRVAARNGQLYKLKVGTDNSFVALGAGGLHATNRYVAQPYVDRLYLSDRNGKLQRVDLDAGTIAAVQAPAQASAPTAKARHRRILESWTGAAPFGWTESDGANFFLSDASADDPWPGNGNTAKIHATTNSKKDTIELNVADEKLESLYIAAYIYHRKNDARLVFELGVNAEGEFPFSIRPPKKNDWYLWAAEIGALQKVNYKRFRCIRDDDEWQMSLGPLILPGNLEGEYRWRIAHYRGDLAIEGPMSEPANSGQPLDFTTQLVPYKNETEKALKKCAALTWGSDAGTDATTDWVVIYRNGGVPSLTKDENGRDQWIEVGRVRDYSTTLLANASAGDASIQLTALGPVAAGDFLVLERDTADEEVVEVESLGAGTTVNLREPLEKAHTALDPVQICFVDNVANFQIDPLRRAELERDDPPEGFKYVAQSPDERLWGFAPKDNPEEVCVSNRRTPLRPLDNEVFPDGVDPITRQDPLQGWRFRLPEACVWGGIFQGIPTMLTGTGMYQARAYSQQEWSPSVLIKVLRTLGCIAGDTVRECNGRLIWVADGPRVVAWDGHGPPEVISNLRINARLEAAPQAYWGTWFADVHTKRDGSYYCLYFTPAGAMQPTQRLDYNADLDVWEPCDWYSGGVALAWRCSAVQDGPGDDFQQYAAHPTNGAIYKMDDPAALMDAGTAINIEFQTKRYSLGGLVHNLQRFFLRLVAAVVDSVSVTCELTDSEYGSTARTYTQALSGADRELRRRAHYQTLKGRKARFTVSGAVSNRPQFRELEWWTQPIRAGDVKRS